MILLWSLKNAKEKPILLVFVLTVLLSACNGIKDNNSLHSTLTGHSYNVIGTLRPKADPNLISQIKEEELKAQLKQQEDLQKQKAASLETGSVDPQQRNLPEGSMFPISGNLQPINMTKISQQSNPNPPTNAPSGGYTDYSGSGFIPPPPAISVSNTPSQGFPYGGPPSEYPNYNPWAPGYLPQNQASSTKVQGSLFGSNNNRRLSQEDTDETETHKKHKDFELITPTGMSPRSPYGQRDDLRILWKGVLATKLPEFMQNNKYVKDLNKVEVGLPSESSKGSVNISERQMNALFKNNGLDKKIAKEVEKTQQAIIQSYYHYLSSYNKFCLATQNVAADKQELAVADSPSEQQRAVTDLSQAQNDAQTSKEDLHASQIDLADSAGAQAARKIIASISGISPSIESLTLSGTSNTDTAQTKGTGSNDDSHSNTSSGFFNSLFGFNKSKNTKQEQPSDKSKKVKINNKDKKESTLSNANAVSSVTGDHQTTTNKQADLKDNNTQQTVIFDLKDIKTTPRKSILYVVIHNKGNDINFDPESISVAEGKNKLPQASVTAEFDSCLVPTNQESAGTITIFGCPWNDKLTVSILVDGKLVYLHK